MKNTQSRSPYNALQTPWMWYFLTTTLIRYLQNNCRNPPMKNRIRSRTSAQDGAEHLVVFIFARAIFGEFLDSFGRNRSVSIKCALLDSQN